VGGYGFCYIVLYGVGGYFRILLYNTIENFAQMMQISEYSRIFRAQVKLSKYSRTEILLIHVLDNLAVYNTISQHS